MRISNNKSKKLDIEYMIVTILIRSIHTHHMLHNWKL